MARTSSQPKKAVYAALFGNLLVAVTKFAAALLRGSSSMLSEGVHSLVDSGNEALLLYGYYRSSLRPDHAHPLGYGHELYFRSFVVALLLFALGAGFSIYEGITQITDPTSIENVPVNDIVLGLSFLFEGASWSVALNTFRASKGPGGYWEAIRKSKDPPSFIVLLEDSAALIGISIAAVGIYPFGSVATPRTRWLRLDSDRYAAGCNRMASGPREQGASDRRTRARLHQRIDPRARRE
jgi:divalent metal cation (Fe/Co/Zn/Cd) transporter